MNWRESLVKLSNLRIPRCYAPIHCQIVDQQFIGFSVANEKAYCGIVYLRSTDTIVEVHVSFVMAKTRVAPIKKSCLPRLELCGALLSPFSTRRICSRDAKRKQEFSNVIGCRSSELFRQPITLLNSCFRFASREQIRLVENGL